MENLSSKKNIQNLFENLDDIQTAQSFMPNESNVAPGFSSFRAQVPLWKLNIAE